MRLSFLFICQCGTWSINPFSSISTRDHSISPKVGVLILSWNRLEDTRACLESVSKLSYTNYQLYVVDNHSTDGAVEYLRQRESEGQLILISNEENLGYAGGMNRGIKTALGDGCDYVFLLDNDAQVEADSLSHLIDRGESLTEWGLIAPLLSNRDHPNRFIEQGVLIDGSEQMLETANSPEEALEWQNECPHSFLLSGKALLIKRQAAVDVGEFDERFFTYLAVEDYCLRAIFNSYLCVMEPEARVSFARNDEPNEASFFFYQSRNRCFFWVKHSPELGWFQRCRRHFPYLRELLGNCDKDLKNMRAVFDGFFSGLGHRHGKWIRPSNFAQGAYQVLALISLGLIQAKYLVGQVDQFNLRNKVRPWRFRHMRAKDYFITRGRNRMQLRGESLPDISTQEVTVILPVRNRYNYRLDNTLNSIRQQDYESELIKIVLVDYGSDEAFEEPYREVCQRFNAEYFRVEGPLKWNLSHATNLVIKRTSSDYVLCTGMDLMLSPNFVSEGMRWLSRNPRRIVIATMYESPEGLINDFIEEPDMETLRDKSQAMYRHESWPHRMNPGINIGLKCHYEAIGGYDERFTLWGHEDDDFIKRMELSGLQIVSSSPNAYTIHQYHPMERALEPEKFEQAKQSNLAMLKEDHSIVRNLSGWGDMDKDYFA